MSLTSGTNGIVERMTSTVVAANYLKVAGAAIFAFDYFQTLPAEIRFYRRQKSFLQLSIACWLLIFARYLGMAGIILSMVGGFATTFTHKSCTIFYLSVPMVKVLGAVASQGIFMFRTYIICNKSQPILYFLLACGGVLSVAEIISPVAVPRNAKLGATGNCISDLSKGSTSWVQYLCQVVFDLAILGITIDRLFRGIDMKYTTRSEITRVFWESQVMYFVAVTVMNIINLIFFLKFNKSSESTMCATLGIAITAIFSSRVILDLFEAGNTAHACLISDSGDILHRNAPGICTIRCRNSEVTDHQLRVVPAQETKSDSYRMQNINGGVHIQREIVAKVDSSQTSPSEWEQHTVVDIKNPLI